jgi:hypothetical protein
MVRVALLAASAAGVPLVQDQVHIQPNQLSRQARESFVAAIGRSVLDDEVLLLDIPKFEQAASKALEVGSVDRRRRSLEHADAIDFLRLRLADERRREYAPTHCNDECPPVHHRMISSARTRMDCGMVRPRAFAVLRLITNSNFVGCSTGRSAGFVPLRILST